MTIMPCFSQIRRNLKLIILVLVIVTILNHQDIKSKNLNQFLKTQAESVTRVLKESSLNEHVACMEWKRPGFCPVPDGKVSLKIDSDSKFLVPVFIGQFLYI